MPIRALKENLGKVYDMLLRDRPEIVREPLRFENDEQLDSTIGTGT